LRRLRGVIAPGGEAIIATAITSDSADEPRALFLGHEKAATWWVPNRAGLEAWTRSAGFKRVEWISEFRLDYRDGREGWLHGVVRGRPE
jgi:hypothetical protein